MMLLVFRHLCYFCSVETLLLLDSQTIALVGHETTLVPVENGWKMLLLLGCIVFRHGEDDDITMIWKCMLWLMG